MNTAKKLEIIKKNTEEVISEKELINLLEKKSSPVAYCGYEISGPVHLGHLVTISKLLDLQKTGFEIKVLLADVHTRLNKKTPETEAWKKTMKAIGIKAEFILGSEFQFKKEYQFDVMSLAQEITINRGLRSMQMLTRNKDNATISQILYPIMQITDIKHLKVDVALGGMDQRKIHTLGKDLSKTLKYNFIALHTPLITSLKGPGEKMSSSIPGSNISIADSAETIKKTISKAYCPAKQTSDNPVLQITKLIIFPRITEINITRSEKFGGSIRYDSYEEIEKDFAEGSLHPADLKSAVSENLEKIISPIRKNFR